MLYSQLETCHWNELHTHGSIALSDFLKKVPVKEVLFFAEIDLQHFAESVYKEFDCYTDEKHMSFYEENWTTFPIKEFNMLEALTQESTYSHLAFITA